MNCLVFVNVDRYFEINVFFLLVNRFLYILMFAPMFQVGVLSADTDRVGGAYRDLPFKVMFKTQLMGLIHWRFHKQQPT